MDDNQTTITFDSQNMRQWLQVISQRTEMVLNDQMQNQLVRLAEHLFIWNQHMNLTTMDDPENIAIRHFMDSMMLLPYLGRQHKDHKKQTLIDVGTGAGFPGLVIKIIRPDIQVCLLDSLGKRIKYLNHVINDLNLEGIEAVHARAEDAAHNPAYRESFDFAVARAVAALPVLSEYCLPFVRPGGRFLAMKTEIASEWPSAAKAVSLLGGRAGRMKAFILPGTDMHRAILEFIKEKSTPKQYPRKPGTAKKTPL